MGFTTNSSNRYDLLNKSIQEYEKLYDTPDKDDLKVIIATYMGNRPDIWYGAAGQQNGVYAAATPRSTSVKLPAFSPSGSLSSEQSDSTYAIGHELGHTFDLIHTNQRNPLPADYNQSIMTTKKPPNAILLSEEKKDLEKLNFFHHITASGSSSTLNDKDLWAHDDYVPSTKNINKKSLKI